MGVVHRVGSSRGRSEAVGGGWCWTWPLLHDRLQQDDSVGHRVLHQEYVLDTGILMRKGERDVSHMTITWDIRHH